MQIQNHRLVDVPFVESPNHSGEIDPELLVIHYTATQNGPGTIAALCSERLKASAHLVVDFDGAITQLVPFNVRAWHAGKSKWGVRKRLNGWSIGIEVVNPGPVIKQPDGSYRDVYKRPWTGDVFHGRHKNGGPYKHWAKYPQAQMNALEEASFEIMKTYELEDVVGHDDVSPKRKIDPGPAFDLLSFRQAIEYEPPEHEADTG